MRFIQKSKFQKQQPTRKCLLKKHDVVKVIAGKEKGKIGSISKVIKPRSKVVVTGINIRKMLIYDYSKKNGRKFSKKIVERESPIHISNVMFYSQKHNATSRIAKMPQKGDDATTKNKRVLLKFNEIV